MEKEAVKQKINAQLSFLKKRYHVKNIGLFGSVVRDDFTEKSDIDIMVEFNSPIGFFDFIRLENLLSQLLQRKVDLVSRKAIKPIIKKEILKEMVYV